jgi:paraquat-inducible protein B
MGITGVNYVEFDFSPSAADYDSLPYSWEPQDPVIPSLPSQADEIISGVQRLVGSLNQMNLDVTAKHFDTLLVNLNTLMAGDGKGNEGLTRSIKEMNIIMDRIAKVTEKGELEVLMRQLVGTMVDLRQTIASIQGDTSATIENLKQASENINEFSRIASQSPSSLIWSEPPPKIVLPMNGSQGNSGAQK